MSPDKFSEANSLGPKFVWLKNTCTLYNVPTQNVKMSVLETIGLRVFIKG